MEKHKGDVVKEKAEASDRVLDVQYDLVEAAILIRHFFLVNNNISGYLIKNI